MDYKVAVLRFKSVAPVFSSGETLNYRDTIVVGTRRYIPLRVSRDGHVILPLKGKLRHAVELILKSKGEKVCDLDKDMRGCGKCRACDIFGSMEKRGRWLVGMLESEDIVEDISNIYTHAKMKRETYTLDPKKVFNMQEVEAGSTFRTRIVILHPREDDLEILEAAARSLIILGVGGFVSRGYGFLELQSIETQDGSFSSFLENG